MERPVAEARGGETPELRREARKVLSVRVPVLLSIAVAALSGVLVGYSLRAFIELESGRVEGAERRERACPLRVERPGVVPAAGLHFLAGEGPTERIAVEAATEMTAIARDLEARLCSVVDALRPLVGGDICR